MNLSALDGKHHRTDAEESKIREARYAEERKAAEARAKALKAQLAATFIQPFTIPAKITLNGRIWEWHVSPDTQGVSAHNVVGQISCITKRTGDVIPDFQFAPNRSGSRIGFFPVAVNNPVLTFDEKAVHIEVGYDQTLTEHKSPHGLPGLGLKLEDGMPSVSEGTVPPHVMYLVGNWDCIAGKIEEARAAWERKRAEKMEKYAILCDDCSFGSRADNCIACGNWVGGQGAQAYRCDDCRFGSKKDTCTKCGKTCFGRFKPAKLCSKCEYEYRQKCVKCKRTVWGV
ncbi:hypothetical protein ADUPG1_009744 [Aduncisulcus paluster]|uniref:Uncharacterized protein n=1 Tax=Aduncisulcus paluster TaxID=2918883 RepID=A0ABQ5KZF9_9EUKA|nr:hypothetical protein ADUPG1_009744 [Aduncisulcus paluster]